MPDNSAARQLMMRHIFHILNFPVGLYRSLGDWSRAVFWRAGRSLCITAIKGSITHWYRASVRPSRTNSPDWKLVEAPKLDRILPSRVCDIPVHGQRIKVKVRGDAAFPLKFQIGSAPTSSSLRITNRSFRYASPHLWNQLPVSFRQP